MDRAPFFERLGRDRFVVIGRAGLDLYPEPEGAKIEDAVRFRSDVGGSAGNIAVALARLGSSASVLSPLADDPVGRFTRKALDRYGVDTALCRAVGGESRNTLALAETRATDCEVVIYRNGAADFELSEDDVAAIDYGMVGGLIATGTALARDPSRGAVLSAFRRARSAGVATVLDLDYRPYSWMSAAEARTVYGAAIDLSDMVVGNDEEFAVVAGAHSGAAAFARALAVRSGAIAVFKMGEKGSVTFAGGDVIETGIVPVTVRKPFGAGDAFMGGMMAALARGRDLAIALQRGSAAAGLVVSRNGCASSMPDADDLAAFMASPSSPPKPERDRHARSAV
ncbi:MAG: PfkB family carbohydrate kinase [Inquilinaceae bacterium]